MMDNAQPRMRLEIPLLIVGVDFRNASATARELLVTSRKARTYLFESIRRLDRSAGVMVLETCNRFELIVSTVHPNWVSELLKAWMVKQWQENNESLSAVPAPYEHIGEEAVVHVLRVVLGLESLAVGEAQIARQFQNALQRSQKEKTTSPLINRLSHIAGRIAKSGYKVGFRANHQQGIHGLVMQSLQNYFGDDLRGRHVLVVGMGDIGRRTAALLDESAGCEVTGLNRTITPEHRRQWQALRKLPELSVHADAIVVATGAESPIVDNAVIDLKGRSEKLLVLDIGIPRQVSDSMRRNPGVVYRDVDTLIQSNQRPDQKECVDQLDIEIENQLQEFKQFCRGRELSSLLSRIQNGRLEITENRIPRFVRAHFKDLDLSLKKEIEASIKQFVKDYSNEIFFAFHDTMEKFWSAENNG